jgi:hypothetical protein
LRRPVNHRHGHAPGIIIAPRALLMQRNEACKPRMAFVLGIQLLDDYGRASWNAGLYFRFNSGNGS